MKDPQYRNFIRFQPCIVPGCACRPRDPHHWQNKTNHGTGLKPGDEWAVPLCLEHHRELHDGGKLSFWKRYFPDKDMDKTINKLTKKFLKAYKTYGDM